MSWEAVTWASRQKLKKSYEQIVLLVLANCADPNGEAFVKWPGREHWWHYLSEKTRLPKSSLFRHLNTLVALGLADRSMLVLSDGAKRPTIKLDMTASFDIDIDDDSQRYDIVLGKSSDGQSPPETENSHENSHDENDSDNSNSRDAFTACDSRQSPSETENSAAQSPPETGSFPVLRLQEDSLLVPKDSPLPPSGGTSVRDELFDEFVKIWSEPIPKMALARSAWDHIETGKRPEVVAAAKGYWSWLKAHPKPPSAQSAQSFLRDVAGWAQWHRYIPDGAGTRLSSAYPLGSVEGKAIAVLHEIVGLSDFMRSIKVRNGAVNYLHPVTPQLRKLGDAPANNAWATLSHQQAGAWESLLRDCLTVGARHHLREGDRAPWAWPPRKDGTLSTSDPPGELSDQEAAELK